MISVRSIRWSLPCVSAMVVLACAPSSPAQTPKRKPSPTPAASASPKPGASPSPSAAPYVLPDVVATVNGEPIKKQDLEKVAAALVGNEGKALQDLSSDQKQAAYTSVLDSMIVDKLVSKEAASVKVDDIAVEKRYADLVAQYPKPQDFDAQVKKAGQTTDQIRQNIRGQLAQQQWLEGQIANALEVTPQEVEKFYKESPPNKFDAPEMIHAEHILVAVRKDAPPEDALKAEAHARELADRVKKGEAFEDVARKQSDDPAARDQPAKGDQPATKGNGGDLDWFSRDRIMPEFGDVAFKMQKGEVSAPVRTQFGYHIIKVLDRKPAHTATLDEARDQITAFLQAQKRQQAVAQVVAGLRAKADVKTFLPAA